MSVKDVRDRIMKNDDNIRNLERERQRTSNLVRDALDREAQTLAHRREQVSAKKREADSAVTDETSPKTRRLIIGLTIVFLVGAAVSVGLAVTSTAGLYLVAQDAFCAATNGYFTPDYRTYSAAYEALDSSPLPIVHSEAHNRSLFWGTYRPHLLAGVKSREKQPLLFGIGWYDLESRFGVRHVAEETNEVHFAWEVHDSRTTGRQIIRDYANNLDINVRFLKSPDGFGWTMRIDGTRRGGGANRKPIAFFLYFATELIAPAYDPHQPLLTIESDAKELSAVPHSKLESGAFSTGATLRVGGKLANGHHFHASVQDSAGAWLMDSQWEAFTWPSKAEQWQMDFRRGDRIQEHRQFHKHPKQYGSILMKKQVTNSFRFDVKLTEHNTIDSTDAFPNSCTVSRLLADREAAFHRRFEDTFQIRAKATALRQVAQGIPEAPVLVRMAETAVSNMLGGLGYWYGEYWVKTAKGHKVEGPVALFSGVPSRAKFPRGFLWDEGFHQLLVARWDAPLSKDIILHWIDGDVVNRTTGWIPREQILGAEPRTRVPNEFVAQNRQHTNPPAMILQVENFARMTSDPNDPFLDRALPAVRRWLRFLKASQCGGSADCATKPLTAANASHLFRWRSRNNFHLLASGLDDYPRPHCKPDWAELHVDLFSWAAMMQKTVDAIEHRLAGPSPSDWSCEDTSSDSCEKPAAIATAGDQTSTRQSSASWADALETIHYDERRQRYSDVTGCTTDRANSKYYSHYFGYVNLFPFLNMVIERPDRALELMRQAKAELSGGYGLQSLSNTSRKQLREHEDYWTGPIWINLNYMMLRALKVKYIPMLGAEAEEFYHELRADLIRNIGREFARTGKLWENYDLRTGQGRGTAPFTGWTALVVAIIAEQY